MQRILRLALITSIATSTAGCDRDRAPATGRGSQGPAGSNAGTNVAGATDADGPCTPLPFATETPIAEASGAAWWQDGARLALIVISDSGHDGAFAVVDPDTGETRRTGTLPLGDGAGDDLEGVATRGGRLHAITSAGWARSWRADGEGFVLDDGPYPMAAVVLSDKKRDSPPKGEGMACGARATNCGRNFEGLCLHDQPVADGACVGFAASKADGHLYCVVERAGKLEVRYAPRIAIGRPGVVADCAFADDGTLWVGANLFDAGRVYRVDGWADPATARVSPVAELGVGFPETLAVRGDVFYRMSDTGGAPSLMARYRCRR